MKVLFVTNMFPVPDYIYFGIHVKEQIDALKTNENIDADVFFINGREKKFNYLKSIFQLRKRLSAVKYDLVHVHYGIAGMFLLFMKPKVPVVITLHSGELYQKKGKLNHLAQKTLTMKIIEKVNKIIVLNDDMINLLKKHEKKLIKLPCGSDLQRFSSRHIIQDTNKIKIGFPGNKLRKEKNYPLFTSIINLLKDVDNIEVVEFHGLTREEVVEKLNSLDVLLMTSTIEGSPQIIKEAMGCNKPIISTNVGDVKYLLEEVDNSYVVDSFNPEEFITPLKKVLALPRFQRVSNGRARLQYLGLDSSAVSQKIYSIYKELV